MWGIFLHFTNMRPLNNLSKRKKTKSNSTATDKNTSTSNVSQNGTNIFNTWYSRSITGISFSALIGLGMQTYHVVGVHTERFNTIDTTLKDIKEDLTEIREDLKNIKSEIKDIKNDTNQLRIDVTSKKKPKIRHI